VKTWIERLNELAAGMLFDGGYVATRHPDRPAGERTTPAGADRERRARVEEAGRRPGRPSTRLATNQVP
jgi:hypothetical protein